MCETLSVLLVFPGYLVAGVVLKQVGEKLCFLEMFWCEKLDRCAIGYMSADVG